MTARQFCAAAAPRRTKYVKFALHTWRTDDGALRHGTHSYGCLGGPGRRGQDDPRRGTAGQGRRAGGGGQRRAGHDGQRFRSAGKAIPALVALVAAALRDQRHARSHHRHARVPRFHRAGDRRARRRRDGGDRGQRAGRHRNDHVADDGVGGQAQAVPPHRRQQDRRRERRRARRAGRDPGRVRQGMPADQSARRRRQARRRLLFQPLRRRGFFVG